MPRLPRVAHVPARTQEEEATDRSETGIDPLVGAVRMPQWTGSDQGLRGVCSYVSTQVQTIVSRTLQLEQPTLQAGTKKKMNKSFANQAPVLLPNRAMYSGPEHVSTNRHTHAPSDKPELQRRSIQELLLIDLQLERGKVLSDQARTANSTIGCFPGENASSGRSPLVAVT